MSRSAREGSPLKPSISTDLRMRINTGTYHICGRARFLLLRVNKESLIFEVVSLMPSMLKSTSIVALTLFLGLPALAQTPSGVEPNTLAATPMAQPAEAASEGAVSPALRMMEEFKDSDGYIFRIPTTRYECTARSHNPR